MKSDAEYVNIILSYLDLSRIKILSLENVNNETTTLISSMENLKTFLSGAPKILTLKI